MLPSRKIFKKLKAILANKEPDGKYKFLKLINRKSDKQYVFEQVDDDRK